MAGVTTRPRNELEVVDIDGTIYLFTILPGTPDPVTKVLDPRATVFGKAFKIETKDWEPADGKLPWRSPLHPWAAGLGPNRVNPHITFAGDLRNRPAMVYAKANADASNPNYLTAPPNLNTLGSNITVNYQSPAASLAYGGQRYDSAEYLGASPSSTNITKVVRNFNGKAYFAAGQLLKSLDASYNFVTTHDFGAGNPIYDLEIFNNELIIAMGPTVHQFKMTTGESFSQSGDTFSQALGQADDKLWRIDENGKVSSCVSGPNTLANWAATYNVGDTTYTATEIIEYDGVPVVLKPNGVFFPDADTIFKNQAPQLKNYPDANNGKGAWTGWGYLWVPSIVGLLRITHGECIVVGPELSNRPDFRFRVQAGVEWNGDQLLVCQDQVGTEQTFICKMQKDVKAIAETPYIYHELVRVGYAACNIITIFTPPLNPTCVYGVGAGIGYFLEGRGSGLDVDDPNYVFGTSWEIDSGDFVVNDQRAIEISLIGIKIIGRQPAGSTISASYQMDRSGSFLPMALNQETFRGESITDSGFFQRALYAPPNTSGNSPRIKLTGTIPANTSGASNRPEIYEAWAWGESHPLATDIITMSVYNDQKARVRGIAQGRKVSTYDLLRDWCIQQKVLECRIPGYDEDQITRMAFVDVTDQSIEVLQDGGGQRVTSTSELILRRVDFISEFGPPD